ncbi:quinone-dependent dihydroorotate dehydrogenase [Saccharothrix coeruleofusca]|uniref:Dihydroorotate dehydrogenase (quinone) n=1 Tax=Saccharothrix coeruleofusca TaxID=33919 RepID=A0A918AK24_9PSEU|nr:quinone-dependent dihydroorotate dehydrogenase [Saccharothrix coeruleofusca]MBP2338386.1 dihydroorotate dehydrogenase [Saccharothrix coeruleofusca]GGP48673.1 dihydroorotate dehydrogenase (quinone) [Saccharothrix coeruleofusca]
MVYRQVVRRALFRLHGGDAERVHETTLGVLARLSPLAKVSAAVRHPSLERTVFGVRFPNPVGLAAGLDKDGRALPAWPALGFGFVEVGTVTRHPQPGNPRPRLYRLRASEAIINRMGFNNEGAQELANRLERLGGLSVPLGISLGKSKVTPVERAVEDYRASLRALHRHGDYFAINISSPNTPGLRGLQDRAALTELLSALNEEMAALGARKPLLVKIAPDLTDAAIGELLQVCAEHRVDGLIATNTTLSREGLAPADRALAEQAGGLSGRPLAARAREVVRFVSRETAGKLPIIGVGGIAGPDDAKRMLDAGASLLQVYTGFIYEGPGLVRRINKSLIP